MGARPLQLSSFSFVLGPASNFLNAERMEKTKQSSEELAAGCVCLLVLQDKSKWCPEQEEAAILFQIFPTAFIFQYPSLLNHFSDFCLLRCLFRMLLAWHQRLANWGTVQGPTPTGGTTQLTLETWNQHWLWAEV